MSTLALGESRIRYEVRGAGYPVLLFAPGFLSSRMERWRTNPARPGAPQDFLDPIEGLSSDFRTIALDIRNAGESRGAIGPNDAWQSYTADHLALLDHLGVERCHVMGACIGVSFALALAQARPGLVSALVLQNPIGLSARNRDALTAEFNIWADQAKNFSGIDASRLPDFNRRMFGNDFLFAVTREFVAACQIPMLIMPGDDLVHPAEISAEIATLAPHAQTLAPWKGASHKQAAMLRVKEFFVAHRPR